MRVQPQIIVFSEQASFGWGGPVDYVKVLLHFLVRNGMKIDLVIDGGTTKEFIQEISSKHVRIVGPQSDSLLKLRTALSRFPKPLSYVLEAMLTELWLRKNYDRNIAVVTSLCSPGRYLLPYGRLGRGTFIFHSDPTGRKHRLAARLFRFLLGSKSQIIAVSHFVSQKIESTWGPLSYKQKVITVLNPAVKEVTGSDYVPSERQYVLMVGSTSDIKNPSLWPSVAKETLNLSSDDRLRFRWVGGGDVFDKMRGWVRAEGLTDKIELPGYDPNPAHHYSEAKVYVHLSKREMLPIAVVDAIRAKIPLVVANVGGLPELCEHQKNGLVVNTDDHKSISRQLDALLENEALLSSFSTGSRRGLRRKVTPRNLGRKNGRCTVS